MFGLIQYLTCAMNSGPAMDQCYARAGPEQFESRDRGGVLGADDATS